MSKYEPLWIYLRNQNKPKLNLTFDEIKDVLGFEIDHSFLTYKKEAAAFGFEVGKISLKNKTVDFKMINK